MEAAMTFSVDDYEKAIARVFDAKGNVIGTGFLVAPGYVLTCAHVVLQAIGETKDKFADYVGQPQELITLDFHVLATGQRIEAEVVAWLPYSLESGDVAALRLKSPAPEGVKPVSLVTVARGEVENDPHAVYGFGRSANGGRSDAYRPKANVAGGRFQLCKVGDPNDETIKPGFSGAPVWNEPRRCVIGMVATAVVAKEDQQSLAYAIPTKELQPVLQQIEALSLHDVLQNSLVACDSEDDRDRLSRTITAALRRCNPNGGDRPWPNQLIDMRLDRAPVTGWEDESPLIYFAVLLAWLEDTPGAVRDHLKDWVERQNANFLELIGRVTLDMRDKKVPASNACDHVIVTVEPVETSGQGELRLSIWAIAERTLDSPSRLPPPLVGDEICTSQTLPQKIRETIRGKLGKVTPIIHLFVPRSHFDQGIEMEPSGPRTALGSEYSCVLRTNPNTCGQIGTQYYKDDLQQKWAQLQAVLENLSKDVLPVLDCQQSEDELFEALESTCAALLKNCEAAGDWFDLVSEEVALPVALWSRDVQFQDTLEDVLDCCVRTLPERIRQTRHGAYRAKNAAVLGHHLSLVWEDPNVMPPDTLFDPEAC
jgi:V8-like Glu-specific endopeptidase